MGDGDTYIHEAGHAVGAWKLGAKLFTIKAKPNGMGEVIQGHRGNWGSMGIDDQATKHSILFWLIGPAAEMKATGRLFNGMKSTGAKCVDRPPRFVDRWMLTTRKGFWAEYSKAARAFCDNPMN
jgi:hypothetical protein